MSVQPDYTVQDLAKYICESIAGNSDEEGYEFLSNISCLDDNDKKVINFVAERANEFIVRYAVNATTRIIPIEDYVGGIYSFTRADDGNMEARLIGKNLD